MTSKEKLWADLFLKHWDGNPDNTDSLIEDIDDILEKFEKRFEEKKREV